MTRWNILSVLMFFAVYTGAQGFVSRSGSRFMLHGKPYFYIGTNYWYGSLLATGPKKTAGLQRLRTELDFLKKQGITNVGPALQPQKGVFDTSVFEGLDRLLFEMDKRGMKAVLFLSNNWEWSGGFLQYLNWNGLIPDSILRRRLSWDEQCDYTSKFYDCAPCVADYIRQVDVIVKRKNQFNGRSYTEDPTIMAWELANEPRPMRPEARDAYTRWIRNTAAHIKQSDGKHLVTLGHEGQIGTQSMPLYDSIHRDENVDYLTIHIWPRNWGWVRRDSIAADIQQAYAKTTAYIASHLGLAFQIDKPLVIEEFGFPRDATRFIPGSPTTLRDSYYERIFSFWLSSVVGKSPLVGVNFWAFNGIARPNEGQLFWKAGDDYMGDPPMEEQSLYGVYDSDTSTLKLIQEYLKKARATVPKLRAKH
jgi:mannan endo-1,4-beta-mannosidase